MKKKNKVDVNEHDDVLFVLHILEIKGIPKSVCFVGGACLPNMITMWDLVKI